MSFTINADDPRTIRALELAADAGEWLVCSTGDGQQAFGVPSQRDPGHHYLVTASSCDCPDFRRGNVLPPQAAVEDAELRACKHMLAVRLHQELVRAQEHQRRPNRPPRDRGHLKLVAANARPSR